MAFGKKLATVTVKGIPLDIFSNGTPEFVSTDYQVDREGHYLGLKYQCVELIRRYLYELTGINFARRWQEGHAQDWFLFATMMKLTKIPIEDVTEGDIICFSGKAPHGHIGIVLSKENNRIQFVHQNYDASVVSSPKAELDLKTKKLTMNQFVYELQGFLRV